MHAFCCNVCATCNGLITWTSCPKLHYKSLSDLWRDLQNSSQSLGSLIGQTRTIFLLHSKRLTVPLFSDWQCLSSVCLWVTLGPEIPLQFRLAAVCTVSLSVCCNGHSSPPNRPHSSTVMLRSPDFLFHKVVESFRLEKISWDHQVQQLTQHCQVHHYTKVPYLHVS